LRDSGVASIITVVRTFLMNTNDPKSEEQVLGAGAKKPYEKPTFRHEQVFVTTALSCGKISGFGQTCSGSPKVS
jgi:hypothetical protein